jgi:hypothetical protein
MAKRSAVEARIRQSVYGEIRYGICMMYSLRVLESGLFESTARWNVFSTSNKS